MKFYYFDNDELLKETSPVFKFRMGHSFLCRIIGVSVDNDIIAPVYRGVIDIHWGKGYFGVGVCPMGIKTLVVVAYFRPFSIDAFITGIEEADLK